MIRSFNRKQVILEVLQLCVAAVIAYAAFFFFSVSAKMIPIVFDVELSNGVFTLFAIGAVEVIFFSGIMHFFERTRAQQLHRIRSVSRHGNSIRWRSDDMDLHQPCDWAFLHAFATFPCRTNSAHESNRKIPFSHPFQRHPGIQSSTTT